MPSHTRRLLAADTTVRPGRALYSEPVTGPRDDFRKAQVGTLFSYLECEIPLCLLLQPVRRRGNARGGFT